MKGEDHFKVMKMPNYNGKSENSSRISIYQIPYQITEPYNIQVVT